MSELERKTPEVVPLPNNPEKPQEEGPKTEISQESLDASKAVAEAMMAGKAIEADQSNTLLDSVARDLATQGITFTPKEDKGWRKNAKSFFGQTSRAVREPGGIDAKTQNGFSEFLQWLPEYRSVVKDVSDKYGFSTNAGPKLRVWQGALIATAAINGIGPQYVAWHWVNRIRREDMRKNIQEQNSMVALDAGIPVITEVPLSNAALRHETQKALANGLNPGKIDGLKIPYAQRLIMDQLPLLFSLSAIPLGQLQGKAHEKFREGMGEVNRSLNRRISDSILMRDFEFLHDASAGELINKIERGRWAVTTLIAHHHIDIVPRLIATGMSVASQFARMDMVGGVLSLLRVPFILSAAKEHIDESIKWGKEEGKKRAAIESTIVGILGSAEVVKTDDVETAAKELRDAFDNRDDVLRGKERALTASEKGHVRVTRAFDYGTPVASALWRLIQNGGSDDVVPSEARQGILQNIAGWPKDRVRGAKQSLNNVARVPSRLGNIKTMGPPDYIIKGSEILESALSSSRNQEILKGNIASLVGLYTGTLRTAVTEARKFEEFLGSQDALDRPDGPKEIARVGVDSLKNLDITVKNVSYKNILHDVSLDIPQGTFLTIKGEKGSGKTTLLRHLMGLYGKESGAVTYGGVPIDGIKQYGDQAFQRVIGYANQEPHILPHMTIRENLLLWSRRKISDERLRDTLNELGMGKFSDKLDEKHAHFSGGEKRLIGIARALIKDPKVLFLDEPTSNLDVQTGHQVMEIIQELRRKRPGMTVVAITHDPVFETIAERVVDFSELNKKPPLVDGQVLVGEGDYNTTNKQISNTTNTTK
ncbi:MAG: ABC transporter ATP-binding protein/permease [Candidatus Gottesmanbacteria bacterium]|nr:ABC transporter ATP-binding protein/permease [Candidatus Gottesmanbacteria bacterium]